MYGNARVSRLDLKGKIKNILHALRKCALTTLDIFLFNDARSLNCESLCYSILEYIKDGSATATKFDSEHINFKTPNVVMVFSNSDPDTRQLSKDRWLIFHILKSGLNDHTEKLWKTQHTIEQPWRLFDKNPTIDGTTLGTFS